eukprot:858484-Prymnesium_polylepis.3
MVGRRGSRLGRVRRRAVRGRAVLSRSGFADGGGLLRVRRRILLRVDLRTALQNDSEQDQRPCAHRSATVWGRGVAIGLSRIGTTSAPASSG